MNWRRNAVWGGTSPQNGSCRTFGTEPACSHCALYRSHHRRRAADCANGAQGDAFFAGRTIYLAIGYGPGGANDVWGRTIAEHLGNHIPGHPRVIVQNVPGAGGLTLMNQLYNISPKDGTFIRLINRGLPFEPLLGGEGVLFDPVRMNWLGSPDRDTTVYVARKDAAVKTMRDLLATDLLVGATGSGADTAIYPEFLSQLLGMKFKTINGYQGTKDISLAMERGEVEGICLATRYCGSRSRARAA